jgi:hypothetical protein
VNPRRLASSGVVETSTDRDITGDSQSKFVNDLKGDAPVSTYASFVVENGRPGAECTGGECVGRRIGRNPGELA